jgi:SAM-dependent methyltransferase
MKAAVKSGVEYGKGPEYWDRHYRHNPEPFDWYVPFTSLKDIFMLYLKKTDNILVIGCGNSRMSEDLFDFGYKKITNIDTSPLVIEMMKEKYRDRDMEWILMDARNMDAESKLSGPNHLPNEALDTIIIKATLDMMTCTEEGEHHIEKVIAICV